MSTPPHYKTGRSDDGAVTRIKIAVFVKGIWKSWCRLWRHILNKTWPWQDKSQTLPVSFHLPYNPSSTFGSILLIRHWLIHKRISTEWHQGREHQHVISDDGSNFVGVESELREFVEAPDSEETTMYHRTDWKFNPPSAPHFGDVYVAMIKSAKKAIKAILGDVDVNDEELHTAICGAERLLNSRQ